MLHVFGEKFAATCLLCATKDERVPVGDSVQPVKIDGGQDIGNFWFNNLEQGIKLNLSTRKTCVKHQLSRDC